jgi:hypothetical protein
MSTNLILKNEVPCSPIDKKYLEKIIIDRNNDRSEYRKLNKNLLDLKKYTEKEFNKLSNDPFYARAMQEDLMHHASEKKINK